MAYTSTDPVWTADCGIFQVLVAVVDRVPLNWRPLWQIMTFSKLRSRKAMESLNGAMTWKGYELFHQLLVLFKRDTEVLRGFRLNSQCWYLVLFMSLWGLGGAMTTKGCDTCEIISQSDYPFHSYDQNFAELQTSHRARNFTPSSKLHAELQMSHRAPNPKPLAPTLRSC